MNVIVSNEKQTLLADLNIEIIKSINGVFTADELVDMFANFFFGRMILDLTALKDYKDPRNLQKISMTLDVEKIIILLPEDPECLAPKYLSRLISMGIYNFTTNLEGINYLIDNPNTYRDVAHIHQIDDTQMVETQMVVNNGAMANGVPSGDIINTTIVNNGAFILGIKNLTEHAGASTLAYMLKKELETNFSVPTVAVEIDKHDFMFFNDKNMFSVTNDNLPTELLKHRDASVILVDLNETGNAEVCTDVIYLLEPSSIKLNRLMRRDRKAFEKLRGRKIVLSQCLLNSSDVAELEYEAKAKFFYTLPPMDERGNNSQVLSDMLIRLGLVQSSNMM